ncbi:MAG: hypothetical protein L7G97_07165 [Acidilobus sp.]|nr:hypothetical protein [Acidilobus sp.]MCG2890560.1 hypothetical protein [Acidilobus sp.]
MASCQPRVPEVKYREESWWQEFFTKDLAEFYASLQGLLNAREALLDKLSGDLAQVLADHQRRDLALRVLFGGLDEDCLEKIRRSSYFFDDCIKARTAAHFYRDVLGIRLREPLAEDWEERKRLLNLLKIKGFEEIGKEKLEISINKFDTNIMKYLSEMNDIVNKIYKNQVPQVQADYGLDLVKAFEDFLNKSIKLLPLYNPFTFFMQSLRSTPRPYLSIMYCEELFSDSVRNLMRKYGVELTKILDPGLTKSDELAVIGHVDGSVGKLIVKLVQKIYDMTSELSRYGYVDNEYWKYVEAKYNERTSAGSILGSVIQANSEYKKYCGEMSITKVEKGVVELYHEGIIRITYDKFLELFSPLMFLGIAWIEGNTLHVECPR